MSKLIKNNDFIFRFYTREGAREPLGLGFGDSNKGGSASDDEEVISAFYQLPEIDLEENDEEKFFSLFR